jgi:hypothetical protein
MARKLRVEYPGAIYHVMNRGDRREAIFRDDVTRGAFADGGTGCCEQCVEPEMRINITMCGTDPFTRLE